MLEAHIMLYVFSYILPYDYAYMTLRCSDNIKINCIICGHILLCYKSET